LYHDETKILTKGETLVSHGKNPLVFG